MKFMSREFTRGERFLIAFFCLILAALAYYWFIDQPIRQGLHSAESEAGSLRVEIEGLEQKIDTLTVMQTELDALIAAGDVTVMGSYDNSEAELDALNVILSSALEYSVSFSNVTRSGDQVRRNFSLSFIASDYEAAKRIVAQLAECELRCLVDDISCAPVTYSTYNGGIINRMLETEEVINYWNGEIRVTATATFFETMVGGTADGGLPNAG